MRALALLPLLLLSAACNSEPRYQLVRLDDRSAYRIDTKTGEVWVIYENESYEVLDPAATAKKHKEEEEDQRDAKEAAERQARERELSVGPLGTDLEPNGGFLGTDFWEPPPGDRSGEE
jgi:hypothetical protein